MDKDDNSNHLTEICIYRKEIFVNKNIKNNLCVKYCYIINLSNNNYFVLCSLACTNTIKNLIREALRNIRV